MREHPVERGDRVADRAAALGVENLERDQCGIGRYPCMTTERIMPVSRDDAGDVRPMAQVVVRGGGAVDEIDERGDALVAERIQGRRRAREIVVPPGDARVDDGDANTGAGEAEAPLNGARADRDGGTEVMSRRRSVVVDPEDFGPRFELPQDVIRQVEHLAVDDAETPPGAREPLEILGKRRARRQRDDDAGDLARIALTTPGQLGIELRPAAGRERERRENEAKEEGRDERHGAPARVPDSFGSGGH